jgi:nitroreductase
MMELFDALATTRSIRRYRDEPIADQDLSRMLWAATRAPTGSNRQRVRFMVLRNGPAALKARALLGRSFRQGWHDKQRDETFVGASPDSARGRAAAALQHFVDHLEQVPVIVLVCLDRYRAPDPYEGASVYPACQNLLLAARGLGYGGVLTMWHLQVEAELKAVLDIPEHVAVSACITLGVPVGRHGTLRRRPVSEVVFDDRWGITAPWLVEVAQ